MNSNNNSGHFRLYGTDYCRKFQETSTTITISTHIRNTGYYRLMINRASFDLNSSFSCKYSNIDSLQSWVYVKEINTEKKHMSGEFEFTGYCEANDSTIQVTNGKFFRIPY